MGTIVDTSKFHFVETVLTMRNNLSIYIFLCAVFAVSYIQGQGCDDGDLQCVDDGECLPIEFRCDNEPDCFDYSDEQDCPCVSGMQACADGSLCIDPDWLCDGFHDCKDGSDELNCAEKKTVNNTRRKASKDFKLTRKSNRCLPCYGESVDCITAWFSSGDSNSGLNDCINEYDECNDKGKAKALN